MSDLVLARNCCLARMLPGEAENGVGMNRSARKAKSVKSFERSNGLDTALYKNYLYIFFTSSRPQVTFPATVQWMVVEFDPLCATAQPEDNLGVYIPTRKRPSSPEGSTGSRRRASEEELPQDSVWTLVMKKFHGGSNWPQMAVILPGTFLPSTFSL